MISSSSRSLFLQGIQGPALSKWMSPRYRDMSSGCRWLCWALSSLLLLWWVLMSLSGSQKGTSAVDLLLGSEINSKSKRAWQDVAIYYKSVSSNFWKQNNTKTKNQPADKHQLDTGVANNHRELEAAQPQESPHVDPFLPLNFLESFLLRVHLKGEQHYTTHQWSIQIGTACSKCQKGK